MNSNDKIWWERIANPQLYISEIVEYLLKDTEKGVILLESDSIPWYDTMKEIIERTVDINTGLRSFKGIKDIKYDPGAYIFEEFSSKEMQAGYKSSVGYAGFLAQYDDLPLHSSFIWVSDIAPSRLDAWITFVADYYKQCKKQKHKKGIFILSTSAAEEPRNYRGIKAINLKNYIDEYDIYVFNSILSASVMDNMLMRKYLAELASNISAKDPEISERCMQMGAELVMEPLTAIQRITRYTRSNGEPLKLELSEDDIKRCVWQAQITILFPIIEEYRKKYIEKYNEKIRKYLPRDSAYGDTYNIPNDMDIGPLWYLAHKENMPVSDNDYNHIDMYRAMRNELAHINIVDYEKLKDISDIAG